MKRMILAIVVASFCLSANAQTGQLDAIKELAEGGLYKEFYGIGLEDGKYYGKAFEAKKSLKFTYNEFDKLKAFEMQDEAGKTSTNHGFGHLVPNHYTQPSVFYKEGHNFAFLYVDGLMYWLSNVEDPQNITSFKIKGIYISEAKADASGKKKKMSMKEKMALLKAGGIPASLTDKDHQAIIKDYLAKMKPIQEAATANFTDEIKKEIAALENADAAQLLKIQEQQRERAQGIADRKAKEAGGTASEFMVKNNSGDMITIVLDNGGHRTVNAGASTKITCTTDAYYGVQEGSTWKKGSLLATGKSSCGSTITID